MTHKTCAVCRTSYAEAAYLALPLPKGGEFGSGLRFRQCPCGNTIVVPCAPVTVTDETIVEYAVDDDAPARCTWAEFCADNADDDGLTEEIATYLRMGEEYVGGGGAAPVFVVRIATGTEA